MKQFVALVGVAIILGSTVQPSIADGNICSRETFRKDCWEDQSSDPPGYIYPYDPNFAPGNFTEQGSTITDDLDARFAYIRDYEGFHFFVLRSIGKISNHMGTGASGGGNADVRGYGISKVTVTMNMLSPGWDSFKSAPANANGTTNLSSTTGITTTYGVEGSNQGAGANTSVSFSDSKSEARDIPDFKVVNSGVGATTAFVFSMTKDMYEDCGSGRNGWVKEPPIMSEFGFQPTTETVWRKRLGSTTAPETVSFNIDVEICATAWELDDSACNGLINTSTQGINTGCFTRTFGGEFTPG